MKTWLTEIILDSQVGFFRDKVEEYGWQPVKAMEGFSPVD
jgi:hypothetical protein